MFRQKLQKFFMGRNGQDQYGLFLLVVATLTAVVSGFINHWSVNVISYIIFAYAVFRILSKNLVKRQKENIAFLKIWRKIIKPFKSWKMKYNERKFYKIFRCPKCRQKLRVPKYKGIVKVRCSKCGEAFKRRT